jgi:predicted SnoaL-like aldol condensation-catalyzing enzyme
MTAKLDNALGLYKEGIRDGHVGEALDKYVGDRYTQHSTGVADGKEGFRKFFEGSLLRRYPNPEDRHIEVVRAFEDGSYVFCHAAQTLGGTTKWVTTDLFDTDAEDRIVEHWDTIAPGGTISPSGHTQTDGATKVTDLERTAANKAKVAEFTVVVLQVGDYGRAGEFISADTYIQHNSLIADGLKAFRELAEAGKTVSYQKVHRLIGQGNFVVTFSEGNLAGTPMAVFDVYRLADGLIVEHWDNMEPIPPPGEAKNGGKF